MADIREIGSLPPLRPVRPGGVRPDGQRQPRKRPPQDDGDHADAGPEEPKPTIDEFA